MGGLRETDSSNPRPAPSSDFITNDYSSHLAKLCDLPLGFDPSHYPDLHAFYLYCKKGKQRAVTPVQQGSGGGEVHADALLLKKEQLAQRQMEIEVFVELWTNKVARDKVEKGASTLTAGQTDSERFAVLDANAVGDSASGKVSGLVSSVGESESPEVDTKLSLTPTPDPAAAGRASDDAGTRNALEVSTLHLYIIKGLTLNISAYSARASTYSNSPPLLLVQSLPSLLLAPRWVFQLSPLSLLLYKAGGLKVFRFEEDQDLGSHLLLLREAEEAMLISRACESMQRDLS